jgi:integrase/recombinase XerC
MAGDLEALDRHLAHLTHLGHRPGTVSARRWCLLRARRSIGGDLLAATPAQVYLFVSNPSWGAETRAGAVSHVRGFFRWVVEHGLIDRDPTIGLIRPRRPRHLPRPMPEPDLARALLAASEPIRTWLYLAAFAGLRCCEIAPLRGEDRHGGVLVIREQKGGDEGSVPIGPVLAGCA